jgi:elongation factor 1 alpha-like protein
MSQGRNQHFSFADFFHDMPWLNVPKDRQTIFIEPLHPRGGLLGGAGTPGKMSKLQQLAAARKKKAEEQKSGESSKDKEQEKDIKGTTKQMLQLSVGSKDGSTKSPLASRTNSSADVPATQAPKTQVPQPETRKRKNSDVVQSEGPVAKSSGKSSVSPADDSAPFEPAAPSAFAQALLGSATTPSANMPNASYALPYMAFTSSLADAFSGPSPDDVVLTAQAKGSLLGARKAEK